MPDGPLLPHPVATGIGSWPGSSAREAVRTVRDLLAGGGLPYLPETPARGPGADLIGRAGALLTDLHVDLQPSGWRIVDTAGRDERRAAAFLREDLDELAEAYDGYTGPLKVQVAGPWTLAASLRLHRGELVAIDSGAARDVGQALADGLVQLLSQVRALVPGAVLVAQIDDPSLPAVLAGSLPTSSGFGRLRAIEPGVVAEGLRQLADRVEATHPGTRLVLHSCAADLPFDVLAQVPQFELSLDASLLGPRGWEAIAQRLDDGLATWLGVIPTDTQETHPGRLVDAPWEATRRVGIAPDVWRSAPLSPACGLAGLAPARARAVQQLVTDAVSSVQDRLSEV